MEGAASILGHKSEKSGTFLTKLAALSKHYGLIDRSGNNIELSGLGKKIAYPDNDDQKDAAIAEMILSVPLLRDLFNKIGNNFDSKTFPIHLREVTGIDRDVAAEESIRLAGYFKEALPYLVRKQSETAMNAQKSGASKQEDSGISQDDSGLSVGTSIKLILPNMAPIIVPAKAHFIAGLIAELTTFQANLEKSGLSCEKVTDESEANN